MTNWVTKYGKWAIITGASAGIGKEFALRLAGLGFNLILIARREDKLKELSQSIQKTTRVEVLTVGLDLSDENFIKELKKHTDGKEIGMLINNAGYGSFGAFKDSDLTNQTDMIKLNCITPTILTHHFLPEMLNRGKGAIIFLGSILAYVPTPFMTTYSATKAFNKFMGDSLWYELKKHNIDVLTLNPGSTVTEFHEVANSTVAPNARTAKNVVDTGLKALGKKPSVVDGTSNKMSAFLLRKVFSTKLQLKALAGVIVRDKKGELS